MLASQLTFLGHVQFMTTYFLSHLPNKSISTTPCELWFGNKPSLDHLQPWGSTDHVHNPPHKHRKLGPKASKMVFIRYPKQFKGYVQERSAGGMIKIDSRNVIFLNDAFSSVGEIRKDVELYYYSKTFIHISVRGRI